jgi:hypothetical protein
MTAGHDALGAWGLVEGRVNGDPRRTAAGLFGSDVCGRPRHLGWGPRCRFHTRVLTPFTKCLILKRKEILKSGQSRISLSHENSLRKVWQRVPAFDELAQPGFDCGSAEELTEDFDLPSQIFAGDLLDELLGGGGGLTVELADLSGSAAGHAQGLAFARELADQPNVLRFGCVDTAASKH